MITRTFIHTPKDWEEYEEKDIDIIEKIK